VIHRFIASGFNHLEGVILNEKLLVDGILEP